MQIILKSNPPQFKLKISKTEKYKNKYYLLKNFFSLSILPLIC